MDICTASVNPTGCGHYDVTTTVDGVTTTLRVHTDELLTPLTAAERETFLVLTLRRLRQRGVLPAAFVNRVTHGDEATNVKMYDLIAPGGAITKTNIGTAYVNVPPGLNGERILVDFTGVTQCRLILNANLAGTAPFAARVIRDSDALVLFESTNLGAAGERELDSGWFALPAGFAGQTLLRLQAKTSAATGSPVYRRCTVGVQ